MKFIAVSTIAIGLVFGLLGCGRAASPADAIALGQTHACADAGVWDGLECAPPHAQAPEDAPVDPPPVKGSARKPSGVMPPPRAGNCDCDDDDDSMCDCDVE